MLTGLFFKKKQPTLPSSPPPVPDAKRFVPAERVALPEDPLLRAIAQRRYGLLLAERQQWQGKTEYTEPFQKLIKTVDDLFAIVPDGNVAIALTIFDQPGQPEVDVETKPFLVARHAVTNEEYQYFVDDGGYEDTSFWPEPIWPHLIDFKDQTGAYAPRFWREARHDRPLARHPVVGICYYEAQAYCNWAGYRLPTEPEWQMVASWQVRGAEQVDRRYPWGDGVELHRCNIWASGHGQTLPVDGCPEGAAPNGALNLIGNTWEWTDSEFRAVDRDGRTIVGNSPLRSIRGGAYDTYFPWQATSRFRSGLEALARRHNVGFRCAMDLLSD